MDRDTDALLGEAKAHADNIRAMIQRFEDGEIGLDTLLYRIDHAALAILDEETDGSPPPLAA